METLPPVVLGAAIFSAFAIAFLLRGPLEKKFVFKAPLLKQPSRQFIMEFALSLLAAFVTAVLNFTVHGFPFGSAVSMLIGVVIIGFFLSIDMALSRQRAIIHQAIANGTGIISVGKLQPMSRAFVMVAIITSIGIIMVLAGIFARDFAWLSKFGGDLELFEKAADTAFIETFFVVATLMAMVVNIIISFSKNLNLLFENQTLVLEKVTNGDLTQTVPVVTADEFGLIASHTNNMIEGLKHRRVLLSALKVAEEVQQNLLPQETPLIKGIEIVSASIYSEETGGDYYDLIKLNGDRLGVVVGDVSGHGIGSALLMASARAFLRMAWDGETALNDVAARVNGQLVRDIGETGQFLTLFLLEIDPASRSLNWVRGGHDPTLLYDPGAEKFTELGGRGPALGIDDEASFDNPDYHGWAPGSVLFIGTDGIWETHNSRGEMFGKDRLRKAIKDNAEKGPQAIHDAILDELAVFRGDGIIEDDVTMLVIGLN